ncbi:dinuclear metal center protein, YbgI/SA1388 family [Clostridium amylolyticum]|uniref:GTP cyclohydrolase 1 type 2 homolog n=1 Tax=Clostridium amylolyticum TaxID=1121298 RepID=A0A1M6CQM9_9CLOT|nr:dinuclear metal center protein, YbgI/SA1388 family [Clostridium amylolyticum]
MVIKLKDLISIMEVVAPPSLKESYDNVGLMVGDSNKTVKRVLLALDCTEEVIDEAVSKDIDAILTHHPLIFRKPSSITTDTLQGRKIIKLISNNISVYSSHTNLDSVHRGMNDTLMDILEINNNIILEPDLISDIKYSGIGRIGEIRECTLGDFIHHIKQKLNLDNLRYTGDLNKTISKVAVINGSGQDYFSLALKYGAHCIVSGDTTYHYVSDYEEMGCSIIDIGHFPSEWLTFITLMKKVMDNNKEKLKDVTFLISEKCKDPYKYI